MDCQDVAALHCEFVEQALGKRVPLGLSRTALFNGLDHAFVSNNFGLGVVLRDQCRLAIAREDEEGASLGSQLIGEYWRPIIERAHGAVYHHAFLFGLGDLVLISVLVFEPAGAAIAVSPPFAPFLSFLFLPP